MLDRVTGAGGVLGVDRTADYIDAEAEEPELVALVLPATWGFEGVASFSARLRSMHLATRWYGRANALSPPHGVEWPIIEQVAAATRGVIAMPREDAGSSRDVGARVRSECAARPASPAGSGPLAETVILGRRSAVAFDGSTAIDGATFFSMLGGSCPRQSTLRCPGAASVGVPVSTSACSCIA